MKFIADFGSSIVELIGRILGAPAHGSRDVVIFLALILGGGAFIMLWRLYVLVHCEVMRNREIYLEKDRVDGLKLKVDDIGAKLNTEHAQLSQLLQKYSKKLASLEDKLSKQPMRLELDNGETSLEERLLTLEQKLHVSAKKSKPVEKADTPETPVPETVQPVKKEEPEKPETSPWLLALDKSRRRLHDQIFDLLKHTKKLGNSLPEAVHEILNEHGLAGCWNKELETALLAAATNTENIDPEVGKQIELILTRSVKEKLKADTQAEIFPTSSSQRPRVIMVLGSGGSERLEIAAELATFLKRQGAKVMLGDCNAGVTKYRENLLQWGERTGVPIMTGSPRTRPGSIAYRSIHKAQDEHFDTVVLHAPDTGEQNAKNTEEWSHLRSLIDREHPGAPHETFLINNVSEKKLQSLNPLGGITPTGLILTGFDLSDHGGLLVSRVDELKLPVRFVVLSEPKRRFHPFSSTEFANALCLGMTPEPKDKNPEPAPAELV